jgi:hypothetical protein
MLVMSACLFIQYSVCVIHHCRLLFSRLPALLPTRAHAPATLSRTGPLPIRPTSTAVPAVALHRRRRWRRRPRAKQVEAQAAAAGILRYSQVEAPGGLASFPLLVSC